jgi:hypothetical protein
MTLTRTDKKYIIFLAALVFLIVAIYFPGLSTSKAAAQEKQARKNLVRIYEAELSFFHQDGRCQSNHNR